MNKKEPLKSDQIYDEKEDFWRKQDKIGQLSGWGIRGHVPTPK